MIAAAIAFEFPSAGIICGYLICFLVGALGVAILYLIFDGTIDLSRLISEPNGDASMARFQFLVFTFIISLSLFLVIVSGKNGEARISGEHPKRDIDSARH